MVKIVCIIFEFLWQCFKRLKILLKEKFKNLNMICSHQIPVMLFIHYKTMANTLSLVKSTTKRDTAFLTWHICYSAYQKLTQAKLSLQE